MSYLTRWPLVSLGDLVAETQYGTPSLANSEMKGIPVLRMNNITYEGRIDTSKLKWIDLSPSDISRYTVKKGDILFNRTNSPELVGKTAVWNSDEAFAFAGYLVRIRLKANLAFPNFIAHFLNSAVGKKILLERAKPSNNMSNISATDVLRISVPHPPLEDQRSIAAILDKADAVRRKRKQAIALIDELVRSAFLDLFGDPVTNPKGWEAAPLESLIDQDRGISYGIVQRGNEVNGGVPVIRISNITTNRFDGAEIVRTAPEISRKYQRTVIRGGELLLSIRGTVGRVAIAPTSARGWNVSREVAVIPLLPHVSRNFVHSAMLMEGSQRFMAGEVKGVAQSGINLSDVRRLPIPRPPRGPERKFLDLISIVEQHRSHLEQSSGQAEHLFGSLAQRAFRGELWDSAD